MFDRITNLDHGLDRFEISIKNASVIFYDRSANCRMFEIPKTNSTIK